MPADSNPPSHPVAGRSAKAIGLFVTLLLICLTADLALKAWSFNVWPDEPVEIKAVLAGKEHLPDIHMVIVPKILALKLTLNRGAVFGVMQGQQIAFIIATILTIGFVGWFFVRSDAHHSLFHIALAMILAGALGNLYDRVTYGAVRDMLWLFPSVNLPFGWTWPGGARELYPWIFNLADAFLLIGIGLIILRSAFQPDQAPAEQPAPAPSSTNTK